MIHFLIILDPYHILLEMFGDSKYVAFLIQCGLSFIAQSSSWISFISIIYQFFMTKLGWFNATASLASWQKKFSKMDMKMIVLFFRKSVSLMARILYRLSQMIIRLSKLVLINNYKIKEPSVKGKNYFLKLIFTIY